MAHQEWTLLGIIDQSPSFYQLFSALQFAFLLLAAGVLIPGSFAIRATLWLVLAVPTPVALAFAALIYPERNMLLIYALTLAGSQGILQSREVKLVIAYLLNAQHWRSDGCHPLVGN